MFQQPSEGDRFNAAELLGALCLFYVHEVRTGITTSFGDREAVAADVHVLDGPKTGEILENTLIFPGALIGSLRSAAGGDPVLGRVGQGVSKPGQSPPWVLQPFTDADAATATAWISSRFQGTGNGDHATTAPGAPQATAAATAPAPTAQAPANGMTAEAFAALPPEVKELLKQTGAVPA
jgi:hypothetical protein